MVEPRSNRTPILIDRRIIDPTSQEPLPLMTLFKSILGRNVIAATLAVLMPICCCVLKTAAAMATATGIEIVAETVGPLLRRSAARGTG